MRQLVKCIVLGVALGAAPAVLAQDAGSKAAGEGKKETPAQQIGREVGGTVSKGVHTIQEVERDVRGKEGPKKAPSAKELAQAYELRGTLQRPTAAFVTVERKGLPSASLNIRDRTQVLLDGKPVEVQDLPEGAQVRARFQLEGEEPVALRIEARTTATGGSGGEDEAPKP